MSLYEKAVKLAARLNDLDRWCYLTVEDIFEKASAKKYYFTMIKYARRTVDNATLRASNKSVREYEG